MSYKRKISDGLVLEFDPKKSKIQFVNNDNIEKTLKIMLARQQGLYNNQNKILKEILSTKKIIKKMNRESLQKDEIIDKLKGELGICHSKLENIEYEKSFENNDGSYNYYS